MLNIIFPLRLHKRELVRNEAVSQHKLPEWPPRRSWQVRRHQDAEVVDSTPQAPQCRVPYIPPTREHRVQVEREQHTDKCVEEACGVGDVVHVEPDFLHMEHVEGRIEHEDGCRDRDANHDTPADGGHRDNGVLPHESSIPRHGVPTLVLQNVTSCIELKHLRITVNCDLSLLPRHDLIIELGALFFRLLKSIVKMLPLFCTFLQQAPAHMQGPDQDQ
mmetsp:Transcript_56294/g.163255  ORF Transcript_56294/g.163255 Transcript_56294/m.163255 type:complete len:218 (+) Transcript_56294:743-1396(+)